MPKPPSKLSAAPKGPLPILLVDVPWRDRQFIIAVLDRFGLDCSESDAEALRIALKGEVPDDVLECFNALRFLVQVDWERCPDRLTDTLRRLADRYKAAAEGPRKLIEQEMLLVTSGLHDHPKDWEFPCACDECSATDL